MVQISTNAGIDTGILSFGGEVMIRVIGAFKIVNRSGYEFAAGKRYFDSETAHSEVTRLNTDLCMKGQDTRLRPVPCFLLEIQAERGEPTYFDLGSPVEIAR